MITTSISKRTAQLPAEKVLSARRIKTRSSQTAAYTCFSRGCATREKDACFRGPDYLAELLFPPLARFALNFAPLRKFMMRAMFPPGIYEYVMARTKVMDSAYVGALEAGFAQIVLLGAGFDTRALRFAGQNQGTRVFELDIATTQQPKLDILRQKKIPPPAGLTFVPIDFDQEDIYAVLSRAGYEPGQTSLFIWEGVTMYLTAEAVDGTLKFIRSHAAPGSRVAFDYIYASVLRRENRCYGEKGIYERIKKTGEGWTFGLEEGEIEPFLAERGFEMLAHYTPAELEKLYLTAEDGALHGRVNGTHCIVTAAVK
ncbi:MAG: SAM-dependent methyltransferase [Anaerolineales bacterium]|nr:SAM-dependent methyltransferase [Anaerolineales bacterium]